MPPPRCAQFIAAGEACGILFGPERTGLVNDHIALADTVLSVPLNPAFSSLNLAQAVLIIGYEWFTARERAAPPRRSIPATAARPTRRSCALLRRISRRRSTRAASCATPTSVRA